MERNNVLVCAVLAHLHNNNAFRTAFKGIVSKKQYGNPIEKSVALANLFSKMDDNITIININESCPIIKIGTVSIAVFTSSAKYPTYAGSIAIRKLPYGVDYTLCVDNDFNNWFLIELAKLKAMLADGKLIPQYTSTGIPFVGHKLFVNHFTTKEDFYALQGVICKEKR